MQVKPTIKIVRTSGINGFHNQTLVMLAVG